MKPLLRLFAIVACMAFFSCQATHYASLAVAKKESSVLRPDPDLDLMIARAILTGLKNDPQIPIVSNISPAPSIADSVLQKLAGKQVRFQAVLYNNTIDTSLTGDGILTRIHCVVKGQLKVYDTRKNRVVADTTFYGSATAIKKVPPMSELKGLSYHDECFRESFAGAVGSAADAVVHQLQRLAR